MVVDDLDAIEDRLKKHEVPYKRQVNAAGFQQIFFRIPMAIVLKSVFILNPREGLYVR